MKILSLLFSPPNTPNFLCVMLAFVCASFHRDLSPVYLRLAILDRVCRGDHGARRLLRWPGVRDRRCRRELRVRDGVT